MLFLFFIRYLFYHLVWDKLEYVQKKIINLRLQQIQYHYKKQFFQKKLEEEKLVVDLFPICDTLKKIRSWVFYEDMKYYRYNNMPGFVQIASTPVRGHLQAVSDDGKITIYANKQKFFVYFYNEERIIESSFLLQSYTSIIKETYSEEADPFPKILTKLINSSILVYLIHQDQLSVAKVELQNYGEGNIKMSQQYFPSPLFDATLHPTQDCLVVLQFDSFRLIFLGNNQPDYTFDISHLIDMEFKLITRQLLLYTENSNIYYCVILLQIQENVEEVVQDFQISKIVEVQFAQHYQQSKWNFHQTSILSFPEEIYFSQFQYDQRHEILAVSYVFIYAENSIQYGQDGWEIYFDNRLAHLEDDSFNMYLFQDFVSNSSKALLGSAYYYSHTLGKFIIEEICLTSYLITSFSIIFNEGDKKCFAGSFDRIASWTSENASYVLTHIGRELTIRNDLGEELDSFNVYTFSTKMDSILLIDSYAQLEYMEWKQTTEEEAESEADLGIILGMVALGVCIAILVGVVICLCCRLKKEQTSPTSSEIHQEAAIEVNPNPYFNKPSVAQLIQNPYTSSFDTRYPNQSKQGNAEHQKDLKEAVKTIPK